MADFFFESTAEELEEEVLLAQIGAVVVQRQHHRLGQFLRLHI